MSTLGNILWLIFGGLFSAIGWALAGAILCVTVIGIPFGLQCFKIAGLSLLPFGSDVEIGHFGSGGLIGNILWLIFLGWELFIIHIGAALVCAVTIIGLPFAKQHLKLAMLSLVPFGAKIS